MARFLAAFFLLNAMALPANADQTNWKLDDVGIVKHSVHGEGVEIRIKPEPIPEGLFDQDADLVQIFRELCSHYAPSVVPFVMEKVDIEDILNNCNYSKSFIKTANDLQILDAISSCYEEYKVLNRN